MRLPKIALFIFSFIGTVISTHLIETCCNRAPGKKSDFSADLCPFTVEPEAIIEDTNRVKLFKYTGPYLSSYKVNYFTEKEGNVPVVIKAYPKQLELALPFQVMRALKDGPHNSGFIECSHTDKNYYLITRSFETSMLDGKWVKLFRLLTPKERLAFYVELVEMVAEIGIKGFVHTQIRPDHIMLDKNNKPHLIGFSQARAINTQTANRKFNWYQYPMEMEIQYNIQPIDDFYSIYMVILNLESPVGISEFQYVVLEDEFDKYVDAEVHCDLVEKYPVCKEHFWKQINAILGNTYGEIYEWDEEHVPPKKTIGTLIRYCLNHLDQRPPAEILADWKAAQKEFEESLKGKGRILL